MLHYPDLTENVCLHESFDLEEFISKRDFLKPYQVKIADSDIIKKVINDEMRFTYCGTPLQMVAPEILKGVFNERKSDVWSFGCLLYQIIMGYPPFTTESHSKLVQNIEEGTYHIPKVLGLSQACLSLISSCLQYNIENRISWE